MRGLYKNLKIVIACTYISFKEKDKKTQTKRGNSQAVPLTILHNTNHFTFFFFTGSSLPGPNDLFKWRDFYRLRILGSFINFHVQQTNKRQHIKFPREHKISHFNHMFSLKPQCFIDILCAQQINWFPIHINH